MSDDLQSLLGRIAADDKAAVGELFYRHRDRLRRLVLLRLDHRLQGRLDPSDVLQEAYVEYARALPEYIKQPDAPFFLWLRLIIGRKLHALHRQHLGTRMRDAKRELSLDHGGLPSVSSVALAAGLLGKLTTPSQAVQRAELRMHVQQILNDMEPLDREILALRHYEQLSNREAAFALEISEAAASVRFIRALRRLKERLQKVPGLLGEGATSEPPGDAP